MMHPAILTAILVSAAASAGDGTLALKVIAPAGYLPGIPVVVRVEIRRSDGAFARDVWDATAVLSADEPGVILTPDRVVLRNGLGSALVEIQAAGDFTLAALAAAPGGDLQAARRLVRRSADPVTTASGVLPAGLTEWSGIVRVLSSVTVPAGATLQVNPGTLVLLQGVASGTDGTQIKIQGSLRSLGTEDQPVTFTAIDPAQAWGELDHEGSPDSLYRYTFITRAGNSPRGGHTNTGPAVRSTAGSRIRFENCTIGYTVGKSMQASGSNLEFIECLLLRSVMGPEVSGTALLFDRSWAAEMYGTDDNDGIYIHEQAAGQVILLTGSVFASGDDDGIDTLNPTLTIEDCIVRDWIEGADPDSKGISLFTGRTTIRRCLIANNNIGLSAKAGAIVEIDRTTLAVNKKIGLESNHKSSAPDVSSIFTVTSSIIHPPDASAVAVRTDYPIADIRIRYSDLSPLWSGSGNIALDPRFVDAPSYDFRLQPNSPCIDRGDPGAPIDPDGTRVDMGAFYFQQSEPVQRFLRGRVNEDLEVDIADPVALLLHLFAGRAIGCADAADTNDDGAIDISDAIGLLEYLFLGGPPPPEPRAACDPDPTEDPLDCAAPACP